MRTRLLHHGLYIGCRRRSLKIRMGDPSGLFPHGMDESRSKAAGTSVPHDVEHAPFSKPSKTGRTPIPDPRMRTATRPAPRGTVDQESLRGPPEGCARRSVRESIDTRRMCKLQPAGRTSRAGEQGPRERAWRRTDETGEREMQEVRERHP